MVGATHNCVDLRCSNSLSACDDMQHLCSTHQQGMLLSRVTRLAKLPTRLALPCARHTSAEVPRRQDLSTAAAADLRQNDAQATVVPRSAGVTDGKWDQQDQAALDLALHDAQKIFKKRSPTQPGTKDT